MAERPTDGEAAVFDQAEPARPTRVMTMRLNVTVAPWASDDFVAHQIAETIRGLAALGPDLSPVIDLDYEVWS